MDDRLRRHALGFLQVRDIPSPSELTEYYARQYYQQEKSNYRRSYPPEELDWIQIKLAQKHAAISELIGNKTGSLLDVGCGEGFAMAYFLQQGWTVSGIDHSDHGLAQINPALLPFLRTGDVFHFLNNAIASSEQYDLVWLSNVLEHVTDPVELLQSLKELVTPGGVLVVTVPNDGTLLQEYLYESAQISERFWIAIPDHISYFNSDSLRSVAESCGWSCTRIIADFPIDWFLSHPGSNYVSNREMGAAAHKARIMLDRLMAHSAPEAVNRFYESMATLGLGRQITAYLRPN